MRPSCFGAALQHRCLVLGVRFLPRDFRRNNENPLFYLEFMCSACQKLNALVDPSQPINKPNRHF
jgi:hypothetical protein